MNLCRYLSYQSRTPALRPGFQGWICANADYGSIDSKARLAQKWVHRLSGMTTFPGRANQIKGVAADSEPWRLASSTTRKWIMRRAFVPVRELENRRRVARWPADRTLPSEGRGR